MKTSGVGLFYGRSEFVGSLIQATGNIAQSGTQNLFLRLGKLTLVAVAVIAVKALIYPAAGKAEIIF